MPHMPVQGDSQAVYWVVRATCLFGLEGVITLEVKGERSRGPGVGPLVPERSRFHTLTVKFSIERVQSSAETRPVSVFEVEAS